MEKIHFDIMIHAPASSVYDAIINKKLYEVWSAEFNPGSTFEGSWNKGDKILFVGVSGEGKQEGMVAMIKENIPGKQISIQHQGLFQGGQEITEGQEVEKWKGAMEEYFIKEENGTTRFSVAIDIVPEFKEYFIETWPKALEKLKEIAEQNP